MIGYFKCTKCLQLFTPTIGTDAICPACSELAAPTCYAVGGEFYQGIEWMACWLLDNVEGETISEEQLRPWAIEAWKAHLKRHNDQAQRPERE